MQPTWIYWESVTDTKYHHEITLFTRKWPLHPPKGRTLLYGLLSTTPRRHIRLITGL
jgi:hypothetical protein